MDVIAIVIAVFCIVEMPILALSAIGEKSEKIAAGLEGFVGRAETPTQGQRLSAQVPIHPPAILENRTQILALAALLRSAQPLEAAGLAHLRRLLTDGTSPLFGDDPESIRRVLSEATTAMEGGRSQWI